MSADYVPDVVDANTSAWEAFTASLDLVQLELERTHKSAPRDVVVHDLSGERFGSRRHRELMWRHGLVLARSRKVLESYQPEPFFTAAQLAVAERALASPQKAL